MAGQLRGRRVGLERIGERPQPLEPGRLDEIRQLGELGLGLAREADDERRPQDKSGDRRPQPVDDRLRLGPRVTAVHQLEHPVVDVLQRHVQVRDDLPRPAQDVVQLLGEELRVAIQNPNPVDALDVLELTEQLGQPGPAVEVDAVIGHVLRHEDELADAVGGQLLGLLDDPLDRLGDVLAPHEGDCAERAEAIAALGDLQIGEVPRRDPQPGAVVLRLDRCRPEHLTLLVQAAQQPGGNLGDLLAAEDADDMVDLGELFEQPLALPLGQAAGDNDPLDVPPPLAVQQSPR